jgi:hypothetical protein
MAAVNDITGDAIRTRILSKEGRDNYDNIFRKKDPIEEAQKQFDKAVNDKDSAMVEFYYDKLQKLKADQ